MGYTHYFPMEKDFSDAAWEKITHDVRRLIDNLPEHSTNAGGYYVDARLALTGEYDSKVPPIVDNESIQFNGFDPEGHQQLGHEDFIVWKRKEDMDSRRFNFCKTAGKPYDLAVCGALIVMHHHAPDSLKIETDGGPEDWRPAFEWVHETLGIESKLFGGMPEQRESAAQEPDALEDWFARCSDSSPKGLPAP